jgi:hypothetical protein
VGLPTEADCQDIISQGLWFDELQEDEPKVGIFCYSAKAQWASDAIIELYGQYNVKSKGYHWMLRFNNYRILCLCNNNNPGNGHHNPDCQSIADPHFHQWADDTGNTSRAVHVCFDGADNFIYGLYWFMRQCNVQLGSIPNQVPQYHKQGRLPI